MKVISVNAGLPRDVEWQGSTVTTGIFKVPVQGAVRVQTLGLQADLSVHGGRSPTCRRSVQGGLRLPI